MIEIIPAIDIIDGRCVRLEQGDFARRKTYSDDPLAVAQSFETAGFRRLHMVDLDGAKSGRVTNLKVLETVAAATNLSIDFSGGIKTDEEIESVFAAGATYAGIGSVAVRQPELFDRWLKRFGGDKILLGADVRDEKLSINGWLTETDVTIFDFISKHCDAGVRNVFVTDIARDGLLEGASDELYAAILKAVPGVNLIASGGVSTLDDVRRLEQVGCTGVIVGKAFYEGNIDIDEAGALSGGT